MTVKVRQIGDRQYRHDFEDWGDVYKAPWREGTIVGFGLSSQNPLTFDDTVDVEVGGLKYYGLPLFYHCRPGFYGPEVSTLNPDGKSLNHAAWAFRVGHKVKVIYRESDPVAVLGHNDGKPPRKCLDIFRLQWHRHFGDVGETKPPIIPAEDWWLRWFKYSADWWYLHYRASTQEEYGTFNMLPEEPDGNPMILNCRQIHLFGKKEVRWGTVVYYAGDWLVTVGPASYIIQVQASGMPGPLTGQIVVQAAVWTPGLEEAAIENGLKKEHDYGSPGTFGMIWPKLLVDYPYPGFSVQTKFTRTFHDRFTGTHDDPRWRPKWITAQYWAYDWDRDQAP